MAPFFSILTPSFNQAQFIEKNIQSVLEQNHASFEHLVIDGGSSDGTVPILKAHPHLKWISEKDKGQADALNKGLQKAKGAVIGWINSDDFFLPGAFSEVEKAFSDPAVNWVIGRLIVVNENHQEITKVSFAPITYSELVLSPDCVTQPSAFYRRSFLEQIGPLDVNLQMVMDYDLWLRCAKQSAPRMVDAELAAFRLHSAQKTSTKNILIQLNEIVSLQKREGVSKKHIKQTIRKKRLSLFKQLLKRWLPKK